MSVDNTLNSLAADQIITQTILQESAGPLFYGSHQHPRYVEPMEAGLLRVLPQYEPYLELFRRKYTEVALGDGGYCLVRGSLADRPLAEQAALREGASLSDVCGLLRKGEEVVVSIGRDHCFSHRVSLPRSAASKIGAVLDLELVRLTPFAPGNVFSGWINHGPTGDGSTFDIDHLVIRKDILAGIIAAIRNCNARPIGIFVRDGAGPALPFALEIDGTPFRASAKKLWARMAVAGFAGVSFSAAVFAGTVLVRQSEMLAAVERQITAVEKDAAEVRQRLEQIKAKSAEISGLLERKMAGKGRLEIIEELSGILPDSAYLDGISIDANHIVADGSAAAPEQLIATLESSPYFQNVTFGSPVFRNPGEEKSHFSIKLELEKQVAGAPEQ